MLPPGPRLGLSRLINAKNPLAGVADLAARYGDPMTIPVVGQGPMVLTWTPPGIEALFKEDPETFVTALPEGAAVIAGEGSVFMISGERHKRVRKMLMPSFHGERMRAYGVLMRDATLRWTERWEIGKRFKVLDTTQAVALDVIIEAIFGVRGGDRMRQFHEEIVSTLASFNPLVMVFKALRHEFLGVGPWARFQRQFNSIRALVFEEIASHRAEPEGREDVLNLILSARDEQGEGFEDQEIFDQLFTIVLAGHETTASSMAWACDLVHRHPEVLARLRTELAPLGRGVDLDPVAVARLPFLEAVCQETLRLYPPIALATRKLRRPFTLGGHELPPGTVVGALAALAHRREEVFPEPDAFRPERFLGKTYSPFEYLPFGGGNRRCLGAAFSMYEMKIVLATILAHHHLTLCEETPPKNVVRAATFGPESGVPMVLESRPHRAAEEITS